MSDFRRRLMCKKTESELPSGFTKLNYLESTGKQYIDTNISPSIFTNVIITFQYVKLLQSYEGIIGSRNNSISSQTKFYPFCRNGASTEGRTVYGSEDIVIPVDLLQKHTINFNDINHEIWLNGNKIKTLSSNSYVPNKTSMYLFAAHSEITNLKFHSASKIFECKIYETNALIMDLLPCLDKNGKPCMFDTVSKQPLYNQGTGEFLYG